MKFQHTKFNNKFKRQPQGFTSLAVTDWFQNAYGNVKDLEQPKQFLKRSTKLED